MRLKKDILPKTEKPISGISREERDRLYEELTSKRANLTVEGVNIQEEALMPPKAPTQKNNRPEKTEKELLQEDIINHFKDNYENIFGLQSIIPSNKDVLLLNLLFAIYAETTKIRAILEELDT